MLLQEARAAGCRSSAEADIYLEQKRRREIEESAHRLKERAQAGANNHGVPSAFMSPDSTGKDSTARAAGPAGSSSVNEMDVTGCYGADLLSVSVSIQSLSNLLLTNYFFCISQFTLAWFSPKLVCLVFSITI